jgi:hypothetical protein
MLADNPAPKSERQKTLDAIVREVEMAEIWTRTPYRGWNIGVRCRGTGAFYPSIVYASFPQETAFRPDGILFRSACGAVARAMKLIDDRIGEPAKKGATPC